MSGSTYDGFSNLAAGMGTGSAGLNSAATYRFAFYSRNRVLMEAMYRGSWVINKAVNVIADDMTRAGITVTWPGDPENAEKVKRGFKRLQLWSQINSGLRWARLYGGAIGVMLVDGQDVTTPLDPSKIGKGAFKGLYVYDRWMVTPSQEVVQELGPYFGKPQSYQVNYGNNVPLAGEKVHYSRVIRFEGLELPYYQRLAENGWGMSIIEPLYDRLVAFDTGTMGVANLIHRAYLRHMKLKGLRMAASTGGAALDGVTKQVQFMRATQSNEGITLMDGDDDFVANSYTFAGLDNVLLQFSQQVCGAIDVPATRMFGQSPAGMNATGDSDMRNHYDKVSQEQESRLGPGMELLLACVARSDCGLLPPEDAAFTFNPLWQLSDTEKATIAKSDTDTILAARESSVVSDRHVLRELQASSKITGRWGSISDEDVEAADDQPPEPPPALDPNNPEGGGDNGGKNPPGLGGEAKEDTDTTQLKE